MPPNICQTGQLLGSWPDSYPCWHIQSASDVFSFSSWPRRTRLLSAASLVSLVPPLALSLRIPPRRCGLADLGGPAAQLSSVAPPLRPLSPLAQPRSSAQHQHRHLLACHTDHFCFILLKIFQVLLSQSLTDRVESLVSLRPKQSQEPQLVPRRSQPPWCSPVP